ncbi:MAG: hypothetical protein U0V75_08190 [Ferruginibacter sp.]
MQGFTTDTASNSQLDKAIKPGDIKAFSKILERDKDLLKKKKKEDKKNNDLQLSYDYNPSELVFFHDASERFYFLSTYGIYAVHKDSLKEEAKTVAEYTGFRFVTLKSFKVFNPNAYVVEYELGNNKVFYKVFDVTSGTFKNVPGLDEMRELKCLSSRSSPYMIFYGNSNDPKDFHQRTILYNYKTQQVESNHRFSTPDWQYKTTLYLHKNFLYCYYSYFSVGWRTGVDAFDLTNNAKLVYSFKIQP